MSLHVADYVVFAGALVIALGIGVYYALTGDRQRTTGQYLLGNRKMSLLPVTISMMVTYISTLTMMGYPTEVFAFGIQYCLGSFSGAVGIVLACYVFLPVFYPLKLTSVNEYLERRFNSKLIKYLGATFATTGLIFYGGNVLFAPCTAVEAMSGFPSWASIIMCSIIAIVYTSIGGFQAVIWTDVFQSVLMFTGMGAVLIKGLIAVGGFANMWRLVGEWDRLNFFVFDPDPTLRLNFYGVVFANMMAYVGYYGYLQIGVQRYSSLPTIEKARRSLFGVIPGTIIIVLFSCLSGMVVFAYYAQLGCDPKNAGHIHNYNQVLPYFVAEVIDLPAFSGLFLSSLLAASLSTVSSAMNSTAAIIWTDILREKMPNATDARAALISKICVVGYGVIAMVIALLIDASGGTMIQIAGTFEAACGGPSFGLFLMGLLVPWVTWKGAAVGSLSGLIFAVWLCTGSFLTDKNWTSLPAPNNCSSHYNSTYPTSAVETTTSWYTTTSAEDTRSGLEKFYSISFIWLREIVAGVTVVTGLLFSVITGMNSPSDVPGNMVHPAWRKVLDLAPDVKLKRYQNVPTEPMDTDQKDEKLCSELGEIYPTSLENDDFDSR